MHGNTHPARFLVTHFRSLPGGLVRAARGGLSGLGRTEEEAYRALSRRAELDAIRAAATDEPETLLMAEARDGWQSGRWARETLRFTAPEFNLPAT